MKFVMKFALVLFVALISASAFADSWNGKILRASSNETLSLEELAQDLTTAQILILGEKHGTDAVQNAQAAVMQAVLTQNPGPFTTAWEFLNWIDRDKTAGLYS